MPGQHDVAGHDGLLRDGGPPRQAQPPGELTLVAAGDTVGQPRVLGVLGDDAVEGADILQGPAHDARVLHAAPVVGEDADPGAGAGHQTQLGQLLTGQPLGDRAHRVDVDEAGAPAQVQHGLGDLGGVADRRGVRHGQHGREAADRGSLGAALDGLGVLPAGLAQVGVQVDEPGQQDQAVRLEPVGALREVVDGPDGGDGAVDDQDVLDALAQDVCPLDEHGRGGLVRMG